MEVNYVFEIKTEILDSHEALLNVEIDEETTRQAMRDVAREIAREIRIPGFRKGRAPYKVVVRYTGEDYVRRQAAEDLLEDLHRDFIEAAGITPYTSGTAENIDESSMTFTIRVPLQPEVDLGDYRHLRRERPTPTVSDEEVQAALDQIREENVVLDSVDRPAELGDLMTIDVLGTVEGDLIAEEDEIEVMLDPEQPFIAPGFIEELVGLSEGEQKIFTVVFPDDFEEASLSGEEATFEVTVDQVYDRTLPELDDALASVVGPFESMDELEADIRERIRASKEEQTQETYHDDLVYDLIDQAEIRYPPAVVEETLKNMVQNIDRNYRREHRMSLDDALKLQGLTLEQFENTLRPQAEESIERNLVLQEFVLQEGIEVDDDDVVRMYTDFMERLGQEQMPDQPMFDLDSEMAGQFRYSVLQRNIMERLEAIATGQVEADEDVETSEDEVEATEAEEAAPSEAPAEPEEEEDAVENEDA
jgi:trigger factor